MYFSQECRGQASEMVWLLVLDVAGRESVGQGKKRKRSAQCCWWFDVFIFVAVAFLAVFLKRFSKLGAIFHDDKQSRPSPVFSGRSIACHHYQKSVFSVLYQLKDS